MKERILFFIFLSFSIYHVKAQMYGYSRTSSVTTPNGTTLNNYKYSNGIQTYNTGSSKSKSQQPEKKYSFNVILLNDSVLTTKSAFHFSKNKPYIFVRDSSNVVRKIYAYQTKQIEIKLNDSKLIGISHDSCWLFKTDYNTYDVIIKYATLPEDQSDDDVIYIQLNDDEKPIQDLTKENLLAIFKDDKELVKIANKNKLIKAINTYNKNNITYKKNNIK